MHELGRYLQREMDKRGWKAADLSRHTGVNKQTVSNLLRDPREFMDQTPRRPTLEGLANGLQVPLSEVLTAAAQGIGAIPATDVLRSDLSQVPDDVLTHELAARLRALRQEVVGNGRDHPTHMNQAGESPANPAVPVSRKGKVELASGVDNAQEVKMTSEDTHPDADEYGHIPLPANYFDLAASGHRNLGAEEEARASTRGEETQDLGSDD